MVLSCSLSPCPMSCPLSCPVLSCAVLAPVLSCSLSCYSKPRKPRIRWKPLFDPKNQTYVPDLTFILDKLWFSFPSPRICVHIFYFQIFAVYTIRSVLGKTYFPFSKASSTNAIRDKSVFPFLGVQCAKFKIDSSFQLSTGWYGYKSCVYMCVGVELALVFR